MEEKKTKFVVYSDDFYGNGGRQILGHVNTFAEGQELLVNKWKKSHRILDDCEKEIQEILSHTEDELVGRDELTLYGSNCYFHEGIAKVEGYVDEESKVAQELTLGEILKRELAEVGDNTWKMEISEKKEKFYLQIKGQDKVPIGTKYEHIVGLPSHQVYKFNVYSYMGDMEITDATLPKVEWNSASAEEVDAILKEYFLARDKFYSEEGAINSLPQELVLDKDSGGSHSIEPYDKYGYHIEGISAYHGPYGNGQGVFIHIRKGDAERIL